MQCKTCKFWSDDSLCANIQSAFANQPMLATDVCDEWQIKQERRFQYVAVGVPSLVEMVRQGWRMGHDRIIECVAGVPRSAKFLNCFHNPMDGMVYMLFEHESFEPVPIGKEIPLAQVEHRVWIDQQLYLEQRATKSQKESRDE